MQRNFCIFCENPLNDSDEHLIPQSINGKLHSRKLICHDCNSAYFGLKIDTVIKKILAPFIHILEWDNAPKLKMEDVFGGQYIREIKGKVTPVKPTVTKIVKHNGIQLSVSGDSKNARKLYEKEKQKLLALGKKLVSEGEPQQADKMPPLRAKWGIERSSELILLLNKIGLEFYALNELPYDAIRELCHKVRAEDPTLSNVKFCNFKNEVFEPPETLTHIILLRGDKEGGKVVAYIELFNLICCVIVLVDQYNGDDFEFTYVQDALSGEKLQTNVALKMSLNELISYQPADDNFEYLGNSALEKSRSAEFDKVLKFGLETISEVLNEQHKKGEITDKEFEDNYFQEATAYISYLTVYEFPYIIEDQADEENDDYNYIHSNFTEAALKSFVDEYSRLIGLTVMFSQVPYRIDGFLEHEVIVKKDKRLTKLYFKLINGESGDTKYMPAKQFLDMLSDALERQSESH